MKVLLSHRQRQVVVREPGVVRVEPVERAALGPRDVRVAVAYAAICGSDLHMVAHPEDYGVRVPIGPGDVNTPGHEYSGLVEEVGAEVTNVGVGERVVGLPRLPCGRCTNCRYGRIVYCLDWRRPPQGCWAETVTLDEMLVRKLPRELPLRNAVVVEPTACALRAIDRADADAGSNAVVIGAGPMGLLTTVLALRSGFPRVLVSEPSAVRRKLAAELGADVTDPGASELRDAVSSWTAGRGADVVFEVVGRGSTVEQAVEVAAVGGTVVIVGVARPNEQAILAPGAIFHKELTIRAAWGIETTFQRAIDWAMAIDMSRIITHTFDLDEVDKALKTAYAQAGGQVLLRVAPPEGD